MRPTPNLNAARAFEAAARHESFARAAGELGVTQAAVSRHVRNLEEELGFALFERGHRSISLTPEGRTYADRLAEGFAIISNAGDRGAFGQPRRVVLDADSDLAASWLLPRLSNAMLSEMEVELDLRSRLDWPRHLPSDSDLAIVWGGYESAGFQSRPFLKSTAFVISAPMLEGGVAPPQDPTLFGNYCLIHERTDGWWRKIMAKAGVETTSSRNIYFHRTYLIADAAARGLGLAVGEDVICAERLKEGSLIRLPGPSLPGSRMFFLLEPAGRRLTPSVRRLRDWLMAEASLHEAWQNALAAQWKIPESKSS